MDEATVEVGAWAAWRHLLLTRVKLPSEYGAAPSPKYMWAPTIHTCVIPLSFVVGRCLNMFWTHTVSLGNLAIRLRIMIYLMVLYFLSQLRRDHDMICDKAS